PVRLAHDVPLQTLADGGLLLAAGFAALVIMFLITAWRGALDQPRRLSLAVLVGVAVACLLDDFSSLPAVMAAIVTLAAWTVAPDGPVPAGRNVSRRWILPAALAVLGLVALPNVVGVDQARLAAADGRRAAVAGDWPVAVERFEAATASYPGTAGYWLGLGITAWHAGDLDRAKEAYAAAYQRNPYDARAAGALAALDPDSLGARARIDEAVRRGITDPQYAFRLGEMRRSSGQESAAVGAFGLAMAIDPSLITVFRDATARHDVAAAALREVARLDELDGYDVRPQVAWDLGLYFGRLPDDAPPAWRAVLAAAHGDLAAARSLADDAMSAGPEEHAVRAAAAVARYACETDREAALIGLVGERPTLQPSEVRDVRDHTYRDQGLGSYQPLDRDPYPPRAAWPWSLVGDPPEC
ncbi:MAG: tetratricopeptide repeat protein, partial [Chloroflexota bacterium]